MFWARTLRAWCAVLLVVAPAAAQAPQPETRSAGDGIYLHGVLPSGEPLRGEREAGQHVDGTDAACVNCHRRSGLGAAEGRGFIPPITGQFLFHPKAQDLKDLDLPYIEGARPNRDPYTDETLARVIRSGIAVDGHPLSVLMPHYVLDDAAMASLIAYLRQLTATHVPGVSDSALHFATIITPDADPVNRQALLDVLNDYFAEKNATARAVSPRLYSHNNFGKTMYRATRRWQLHVWELAGPAESWGAQLQRHLAAEPVFAVISGLGGRNWAPVHRFCEQNSLPCLFPNVDLPVIAESDFHSLYFSKGVLLEAGLIAQQLEALPRQPAIHRLVQIYRADDVGAAAAAALDSAVSTLHLKAVHRVLKATQAGTGLAAALKDASAGDAVVLWLRPKDIAALDAHGPKATQVWMSGRMGGLDDAPLPAKWRSVTRVAYPFDLPDKRRVRVDYPLGWFSIRHVKIVDFQLQADTYLACGLLSETLNHIGDTFVRDYLIERIEGMLEKRIITGYYPRLTLAPGQRFASKGGYVVRFADPTGSRLVAASDWITP